MISESILAQIDAIEAKALHIVAQRDSAIKDAEESIAMYRRARDRADAWKAIAEQLAEALRDASCILNDYGDGCKEYRKELLDKYDAMVKASK